MVILMIVGGQITENVQIKNTGSHSVIRRWHMPRVSSILTSCIYLKRNKTKLHLQYQIWYLELFLILSLESTWRLISKTVG